MTLNAEMPHTRKEAGWRKQAERAAAYGYRQVADSVPLRVRHDYKQRVQDFYRALLAHHELDKLNGRHEHKHSMALVGAGPLLSGPAKQRHKFLVAKGNLARHAACPSSPRCGDDDPKCPYSSTASSAVPRPMGDDRKRCWAEVATPKLPVADSWEDLIADENVSGETRKWADMSGDEHPHPLGKVCSLDAGVASEGDYKQFFEHFGKCMKLGMRGPSRTHKGRKE